MLIVPILVIGLFGTNYTQTKTDTCFPARVAFYNEVALGSKDGVRDLYQAEERAVDPGFIPNRPSISREQEIADYKRRRNLIVGPILNDLRSRMAEIARSNDILLLEGSSLDEANVFLALDNRLDITSLMILHFNDASFKPGLKAQVNVPYMRVGVIDSTKLYGSSDTLHGFESVGSLDLLCKAEVGNKCKQLFDLLQKFSIERKYGMIFDSSKDLPSEIRLVACYEATAEFIEFFNRNVPRPK